MKDMTEDGNTVSVEKGAITAGFCRPCRCSKCSCGWWTNWLGSHGLFSGDRAGYAVF